MAEIPTDPPDWDEKPLSDDGDSSSDVVDPITERSRPSRAGGVWVLIAGLTVAFLAYFFLARQSRDAGQTAIDDLSAQPDTPSPPAEELDATPGLPDSDELEAADLPALGESDPFVRDLLAFSQTPLLTSWLAQSELVRKFVGAVDNVANGIHPGKHVGFLKPETKFVATRHGDSVSMGPASYARYDAMMAVFRSVPPERLLDVYRRLSPLLEQAYAELGYGGGMTFESSLNRAIDQVLAVPVVEGPIALIPRFSSYRYRDPSLASLTNAQKLFLRLGPDHLQALQSTLRECRGRL